MHAFAKYFEKGLALTANGAWFIFRRLNQIRPGPSFKPLWSDQPLLKSWQKTKPPLGWPRQTDSLCPLCVGEIRQEIIDGQRELNTLIDEKAGEIKATILERDGRILMVKDCPTHGHFEDVISIDPAFSRHLEQTFPGRDIAAHRDEGLHNHGSSSIRFGRGAVLTIDLTNRCNMMCDPCFMDANQIGFVHEPGWDHIQQMLDDAVSIRPRRQLSVQFSGGEPTLSPHFIEAVRYARKVGYKVIQVATNGIEFAKHPELAVAAAEAGLRYAYLQFDGIGNRPNSHRGVSNLFDVKLQAIENLFRAGVGIVPVITIVNGVNNEQVGRVIQFALDNPKKVTLLAFQPVSFSGRDEAISDERRFAQRYTLSHLAHDVKNQAGIGDPVRDWFPISFLSTFSDWADLVHGPQSEWGQLACGCHPNCGTGMAVMVDKFTKEAVPMTAFLRAEQFSRDITQVNDARRGRFLSLTGMFLALLRNYDPFMAPSHFRLIDLLRKFQKKFGGSGDQMNEVVRIETNRERIARRKTDRWNFLFIAGMWFQDLFNYDFRRTEMCIIPYATQEGEISFCAYNTGVGWRQIVEKMHLTATLQKWYEQHGRHEIFAAGKSVPLPTTEHSLTLDPGAIRAPEQEDLDRLQIPKTARAERRAIQRDQQNGEGGAAEDEGYHLAMARLYSQHVLGQQPTIQIQRPTTKSR